jgi:hypothetical protein
VGTGRGARPHLFLGTFISIILNAAQLVFIALVLLTIKDSVED